MENVVDQQVDTEDEKKEAKFKTTDLQNQFQNYQQALLTPITVTSPHIHLMISHKPSRRSRPIGLKLNNFAYGGRSRRATKFLKQNKQALKSTSSPTIKRTYPEVSIPGLNRILDNQGGLPGKVLWTVAVLACLVACFSQVYMRVENYFSYPISVDVSVEQPIQLTFPSVTLCPFEPFLYNENINAYRRKYALEKNITYKDIEIVPSQYWNAKHDIDVFDLLDLEYVNVTLLWELARIGKHNINESVVLCQFHSKKNCHLTIKEEEVATFMGTCLTLSLSDDIRFDGSYNGMEVLLHGYRNEYMYWQYMMLLHERNESPNHNMYYDAGQVIHPGYETTATFTTKRFVRSNLPNRPCSDPVDARRCRKTCFERAILSNSTCRLPYLESSEIRLCSTPEEAKHTYKRTLEVYDNSSQLCSHCHQKCIEIYFSVTQDVVKEKYEKNITQFKVLMQDDIIEIVTEQKAHTFDVLLSEIGGSLGLFLGVCLLTGLQVIEFLVFKIIDKL